MSSGLDRWSALEPQIVIQKLQEANYHTLHSYPFMTFDWVSSYTPPFQGNPIRPSSHHQTKDLQAQTLRQRMRQIGEWKPYHK
jgi:hypothetical protein